VGTEAIARARPDGYTIGLASVSALSISPTLYSRIPFDPERDFSFIGGLWRLPNMLVLNKDVPANTVPELTALIRANPGTFSFASSGAGTSVHLSGEMYKFMAQLDMEHVPYRGGAPAHIDLLAGRVQMIFDNIPQGLASWRDGKVKALAVTTAERSPSAPDVPTMAEFFPGFDIDSWGGVSAPAGLPPAMLARMTALCQQALGTEEVKRKYFDNGATTWPVNGPSLAAFRRDNEQRFAPLIRASGARVD
jgi:tripartite-type tricarboxylate transporter receptor subunit TctC